MIFRKAEMTDIDVLLQFRFTYIKEYFGELNEESYLQLRNQLPDYFKKHLGSDFIAYLAETSGKVVGIAFLIINEKPANPNFITGRTGLVLNVYTCTEYRGQGIATTLLNKLIEEGRNNNLSYIELSATKAGEPIYRKIGFTEKVSNNLEMKLKL